MEIDRNDLTERVGQMLTQLVKTKGFEFPIHVVAVSCEGRIIGGTYSLVAPGELDWSNNVDNMKHVAIYPPVHVMFVDGKKGTAWLGAIGEDTQIRLM